MYTSCQGDHGDFAESTEASVFNRFAALVADNSLSGAVSLQRLAHVRVFACYAAIVPPSSESTLGTVGLGSMVGRGVSVFGSTRVIKLATAS